MSNFKRLKKSDIILNLISKSRMANCYARLKACQNHKGMSLEAGAKRSVGLINNRLAEVGYFGEKKECYKTDRTFFIHYYGLDLGEMEPDDMERECLDEAIRTDRISNEEMLKMKELIDIMDMGLSYQYRIPVNYCLKKMEADLIIECINKVCEDMDNEESKKSVRMLIENYHKNYPIAGIGYECDEEGIKWKYATTEIMMDEADSEKFLYEMVEAVASGEVVDRTGTLRKAKFIALIDRNALEKEGGLEHMSVGKIENKTLIPANAKDLKGVRLPMGAIAVD